MSRANSVGAASRAALLVTVAASSLFCATASAQGQRGVTLPPNNEQTELFRGLLHFHGIEPESTANLTRGYDYSKLIVVVYGPSARNAVIEGHARRALESGGAVLIANNGLTDLNPYLPGGGNAAITGQPVLFPHPQLGIGATQRSGTVVPVQVSGMEKLGGRALGPRPEMELFAPFNRVEVASSSYLTLGQQQTELARAVARFPTDTQLIENGRQVKATDRHVFAAAGVGPKSNPFRCVVMASLTVLSNQMIYTSGRVQDPTDNLKFANALVQWLKEGPEGGRTRCLFIEKGNVMTKFDDVNYSSIPLGPPMPPIPIPPIPNPFDPEFQGKVTDVLNKGIDQAQEEDRLGKFLGGTNERKAAVYLALAVLAAIVVYLLVRFRTLAARFKALFLPVPKDPLRLGPDTVAGSVEHRRLEILRAGNYSVPVRSYIRQLFEERGLPPDYNRDWPPRFRYNLRNREFVRQALTTLWAELTSTKPINYSRWKELEPLLAAARAAADDDRWWIEIPSDEGQA